MSYLSEAKDAAGVNVVELGTKVMAQGGPGSWTQLRQIIGLWLRMKGFKAEEYYTYGLWRRDLPPTFLREFQTGGTRTAFNHAILMPGRGHPREALDDKVATATILRARGLPVIPTLAAFGPATDDPDILHLADGADIARWLSEAAALPVFGKPRFGSYALGAAAITGHDGAGNLRFLNGRNVPAAELGAEIEADWARGYIFQPFCRCAAELRSHVGEAMASIRICTLRTANGIEPWYGVIRIPAQKAMHDGDAKGPRIWGLIDIGTGRILRLAELRDPMAGPITHVFNPETPFLGATLPHWRQAVEACIAGHEAFEGNGVIGWDVFLTDEGALLNEANHNPGHLYQVAAGRGLRNPDLEPAYQRALAYARAINAEDGVSQPR